MKGSTTKPNSLSCTKDTLNEGIQNGWYIDKIQQKMQINKSENRNITKSLIHGLKKVFNCTKVIL